MEGEARKKPVVIQFFEWEGDVMSFAEWMMSYDDVPADHSHYDVGSKALTVKTLEGSSYDVPLGYMIIRGIKGEYYPCESEIFLATYEIIT
jgi:hypothetical protein